MTAIVVQLPGLSNIPQMEGGRGVMGRRKEREDSMKAEHDADEDDSQRHEDDDESDEEVDGAEEEEQPQTTQQS
jgi:hypothetical protein